MADDAPPAWFTESVERPWRFGDRVRVRLSAECQFRRTCTDRGRDIEVPHFPETDGADGTVMLVGTKVYPGHPVLVKLPSLVGIVWPAGDWFAPCELEAV